MGCSCENSSEEIKHYQANIKKIKENCVKEYNSYLNFIYKLKGYLNVSQCTENLSMDEIEENKHEKNIATKKEFYLIPSKWFEDWEKWIKNIIIKNEFKALRTKFKYQNFKNKEKFYFYLMTEENWVKISKNKLYNFSEEFKTKIGLISNNLIILQYDTSLGEKNEFEIFFFEKDDDLCLTNLLFSFEKCENSNSECNNLLSILKSSPIYEILGNMHYDKSKSEFIEPKKKIIIYNKTRIVNDDIKQFRKKQYEIFLWSIRFVLMSLGTKTKNFYSDLISFQCFDTLSKNFLPGKPATFDIFKESYEIIKENLTRDPLKYGSYICSCGYNYSVGECTFPTVISTCPICGEKIGGEHHILFKRVGHMRIFLNSETRKTKFDLSYADKNMNNMLLDDFYNTIVSKHETKE